MASKTSLSRPLIETIRGAFHSIGVDIHRLRDAPAHASRAEVFKALVAVRDLAGTAGESDEDRFLSFCAANALQSRAQLMQDLFVLHHHKNRRNGYFVEFGAADGVSISNTFLLESAYGWEGVVAEPARFWHERLRSNRACTVDTDCVWRATGETLLFNETRDREYSTLDSLSSADWHAQSRVDGQRYEVRTVSLLDLLARAGAPAVIDYMSVDTEGSEFDILDAFDFDRYDVRIITVEHNFTPNRERLHELLCRNGYSRRFEAFSQWDDWYVRS